MIRTLFVAFLVAAIAEQADLVFRDGGNSCTIFKTEGTRTVHSQCDFHSPNIDAELVDLRERMTRVEAALPATPSPTEKPTDTPTKTPVPGHPFPDKPALKTGVDLWMSDRDSALTAYGDISTWDVTRVTDMEKLFDGFGTLIKTFNDPIGDWDTSSVTNMESMFLYAEAFNQPIGAWDTSNVETMRTMFAGAAAFNQPIGDWDTSSVTTMWGVFSRASVFDQPIGDWDTSKVTDMSYMLYDATVFNQQISAWDTSKVTKHEKMCASKVPGTTAMTVANKCPF